MAATKGTVQPRLSRGLRDLFSEQMLARHRMIETIRGVYELYGFTPLGTPAIEYLDVLAGTAGQETQQAIFTVANPESEALGLRFDLTVPLARVVAQYHDLPRPYRRYQVSTVWRADKPDKGRYREFIQFDLDSVGVESEIADTEIIAGMCDALTALAVGPFQVRFSSRGILDLLLASAGVPAEGGAGVLRVLDKLEKVGLRKVKLELTTGYRDESGDTIRGLGLAPEHVARIESFLEIRSSQRREVISRLRAFLPALPDAAAAIDQADRSSGPLGAPGYGHDRS